MAKTELILKLRVFRLLLETPRPTAMLDEYCTGFLFKELNRNTEAQTAGSQMNFRNISLRILSFINKTLEN